MRNHWTFLTNHAQVLLCIARDRQITTREIADRIHITERAVQGIIRDLKDAGYLSFLRDGRRNVYTIHSEKPLRHPAQATTTVADFLALFH